MNLTIQSEHGIGRKLWIQMTRTEKRLFAYEHFRTWLLALATDHSTREIGFRAGIDHSTVARLVRGQQPGLDTAKDLIETWIP